MTKPDARDEEEGMSESVELKTMVDFAEYKSLQHIAQNVSSIIESAISRVIEQRAEYVKALERRIESLEQRTK